MPWDLIYAIINFLILAAIVFLFGRKMIVNIFKGRRERLNTRLDEAEAGLQMANQLREDAEKSEESSDVCDLTHEYEAELSARINKINEQLEADLLESDKHLELERMSVRREMLNSARAKALTTIIDKVKNMMSEEPYVSDHRALEEHIAQKILKMIKLTHGDMSYLIHKKVLYVTLTSAYPLNQSLVDKIGESVTAMLDEVGGIPSYWVKTDPSLIGGLSLRIGDTVYDGTVLNIVSRLSANYGKKPIDISMSDESFVKSVANDIMGAGRKVDVYQVGRVISVSDGICWLDGLSDIMYGEVVEFACGEKGMILDIESDKIGCVVFGKYEHLESGTRVRRVGRIASVPVGEELLGRVVDPLGAPLDGKGRVWTTERRPIEAPAATIPQRKAVSVPMHTGIKAIDALVPIGRGQRELVIGDRQSGKTAVIIDTILNQKGKNVYCIYVSVGQKETSVASIKNTLEQYGAMEYTTIVCANASNSASMQYIAPFAGTAMGEYFMYSGKDVLIIYDDLSKHAVAYRELSLLLHRPSGREAYPGDVFYLHSRLLERSACLSDELGGGTMTAIPIIETQAGDISSYIPTNVISITDGQIFLETDLFNEGQRPAVNVGLSVSRVGSSAQTKLMKQVSSRLRMDLAQYRELASFAQFGADVDDLTRKTLDAGARMMAILRQERYSPLPDELQALIIFAVAEGYADNVPISKLESAEFERALFEYFEVNCEDVLETMRGGSKMTREFEELLRRRLSEFVEESFSLTL